MKLIQKIILHLKLKKIKLRGESIVEVVTATVILATILVSTFSILGRATQTNANIRNRVIALNIAREGIEGVRNIRDTNWLKYSGNRRDAWLCLDSTSSQNACDSGTGGKTIPDIDSGETYYIIDFDKDDERYYLEKTTFQDPINLSSSTYATDQEEMHLYRVPTPPRRYTHTSTGYTPTIFYRQLALEVLAPYNTSPTFCTGNDSCENARLKVISKVQWKEDGALRTTTLETHLFDFFERNEY